MDRSRRGVDYTQFFSSIRAAPRRTSLTAAPATVVAESIESAVHGLCHRLATVFNAWHLSHGRQDDIVSFLEPLCRCAMHPAVRLCSRLCTRESVAFCLPFALSLFAFEVFVHLPVV